MQKKSFKSLLSLSSTENIVVIEKKPEQKKNKQLIIPITESGCGPKEHMHKSDFLAKNGRWNFEKLDSPENGSLLKGLKKY